MKSEKFVASPEVALGILIHGFKTQSIPDYPWVSIEPIKPSLNVAPVHSVGFPMLTQKNPQTLTSDNFGAP